MSERINRAGQRYGCLVMGEYRFTKGGVAHWECLCDCGKTLIVRSNNVASGNSRSCGDPRFHTKDCKPKPIPAGVLFDEDDRKMLERYSWHINDYGYAVNRSRGVTVRMHRIVLGLGPKEGNMEVDHINGNPRDNRKENLRVVPRCENMRNLRGRRSNSPTGFRGVSPLPDGRFLARAMVDGKNHMLGRFPTAEEAATVARDWRLKHMPGAMD